MKIITAVVNNPIFIEIQYHTLKKYVKGNYEFIVFNDAKDFPDFTNEGDVSIKTQIEIMCKKYNIKCINIPNDNHNKIKDASIRTADSMNFILTYQKKNIDKYLLIDSDMFLIDNFDTEKYNKYETAIVLQSRNNNSINYFWNGIYYFDMSRIKNINLLNWNVCQYCDTGGMMQQWLKIQMNNIPIPNTDEIRWTNKSFHTENIYFIKHLWSCSWDESEIPDNIKDNKELISFFKNDSRNKNNKYFCEIYDNVFLHYRAGGNWNKEGMKLHIDLSNKLKKILV